MTGLYTIPLTLPFVDVLADGLLRRAGGDRLQLPRTLVLLPTRRACRALREAFLRQADGPMLLPRMQALGDLDADELTLQGALDASPAIAPLRRQSLLARALLQAGYSEMPAEAASVARSLARFLDEVQTEEITLDALSALVPDAYAEHWQKILVFLDAAQKTWPALLAIENAIDPVERRTMLYDALAQLWIQPSPTPVVIAGSNGSIKAVRRLMRVVAGMPNGEVILHGVDQYLDEEAWQEIEPSHPQYAFSTVIRDLGLVRTDVAVWPEVDGYAIQRNQDREALIGEMMRPSGAIAAWHGLDAKSFGCGLDGISRMECATLHEEADAIAALFREVLETPGKRAALVTPDRDLARLVAASLKRWDIVVDDSAGTRLAATPPGAFMRLSAAMVAEDFAPLALLACLKHPLATGGLPAGEFRRKIRALELAVLRGPAPAPGLQGLLDGLDDARLDEDRRTELRDWLHQVSAMAKPFSAILQAGGDPVDMLRAHVGFAEALARPEGGAPGETLWKGDTGQALADFVTDAISALAGFPAMSAGGYGPLLESLMAGYAVRSPIGQHPRLSILGTMEARLQQADLVVLGGLNEGTWPEANAPDPFLSRPMREGVGLPVPEYRIGLSAHDFVTGFAAPEAVMTRALRVKGVPTVASRWLLRLDAVLRAAQIELPLRTDMADWIRRLDTPDGAAVPAARPEPRPPLTARPRRMSVSDVQAWIEDPYRLYARRILHLRQLDPIGAEPGAADKGTIIHALLEWFTNEYRHTLPPDALERLIVRGRQAFDDQKLSPALETFWWPRFMRIAEWIVALETSRRSGGIFPAAVEISGTLVFEAPGGAFTLTAKADRIDRHPDGTLEIIDYKTGGVPDKRSVEEGQSPQLPLEAAIAEAGGFPGLDPAEVPRVAYWKLTGAADAGKEQVFTGWPREILDRLKGRVAEFDRQETAYAALPPGPQQERLGYHRAYEHLSRLREWVGETGDE